MSTPTNILSLDVGGRRIGVALASSAARMASPLLTLDRQDEGDIIERIKKIVTDNEASIIVVGLPRGMEGQDTDQTAVAREFADSLKGIEGISVHMQDEAATSIAAEERLKQTGKPYQKGDIDMHAAAIILEDWLAGTGDEV